MHNRGASATVGPGRLAFVDLMRLAAIASVVVIHLYHYYGATTNVDVIGLVAINAFFVLSGFLLSNPYLNAILKPNVALPLWREYATRRFLRLYPLYSLVVVTTAAPFLFAHRHHGVSPADVIAHLTFTHGFFPAYAQSAFNVPLWTMAVEVQFYIILPIAGFVLYYMSRKMSRVGRRNLIVGSIVASAALSLIFRAIVYKYTSAIEDLEVGIVYARNAIGCAGGFALGIGIALAKIEGVRPSRLASSGFILLSIGCCAWIAASGAQTSNLYGVHVAYDFVCAIAAAAILFGVGLGDFPELHTIANLPIVTWAASISFGIYCFHKPFSLLAIHIFSHRLHPGSILYGLAVTALTLGLTIPVATLTYRFVEVPFLKKKRLFEGPPVSVEAETGTAAAQSSFA